MPNVYPYYRSFMKNVKQTAVPAVGAQIEVFRSGTNEQVPIYSDVNSLSEIEQPTLTDTDGAVFFYVEPGRVRLDVQLDGSNVVSVEESIVDTDNLVLPVVGEIPSGNVDGVNTVFTLTRSPNASLVALYVDGNRFRWVSGAPGAQQFSVTENIVTCGTAPNAVILADYWVAEGAQPDSAASVLTVPTIGIETQVLSAATDTIISGDITGQVELTNSSGGSLTMISAPTINTTGVSSGKRLLLVNAGVQDIILRDQSNLAGTKLRLPLGEDLLFQQYDSLSFIYSAGIDAWVVVGSSNN